MYPIILTYKNKRYWIFFIIDHDEKEYDSPIKSFLQVNYRPDHLICIIPTFEYDTSRLALHRIGKIDSYEFSSFLVDENGSLINVTDRRKKIDPDLYLEIKNHLYREIFSKHESIIKASEHSYFLLPNDKLSTSFIRIGNTLKCSHEIGALSMFILPHLRNNPANIYCDSPSIFPLVYSAVLLKNIISKKTYCPTIKSFNTYGFLIDDIEDASSLLFLISMTVSGSTPKKLNRKGHNWQDILILYNFFKRSERDYKILMDFSSDDTSIYAIEEFESDEFKKKFPERTFEIRFDSDQFLPTAPQISKIKLAKDDAPNWLSKFIERYKKNAGTGFITCYKGVNSKDNTRDLYFDIREVLISLTDENPNDFEEKTYKLLINNLPVNLKGLIYIDNDESKYIAELIYKYYFNKFNINIPLYHTSQLILEPVAINEHSNYLVCVSCVSEGKKISNVSRILRKLDNAQITYFCGIVRCKSEFALKDLRSNLTYGRYGFKTYNLITVEEIILPNEDSLTLSWEQEKLFLEELLSIEGIIPEADLIKDDRDFFKSRLDDLTKGSLINNVFLKSTRNKVMLLNKNFAFFDFYGWSPNDIPQCIVYFAILSVFHNHRLKYKVVQSVFERHLLDPENFNRFNDGIIQAALLRTAQAEELKYSLDPKSSELIADLIINIIKNEKTEDSAPLEFLLTICTGKMTLLESHCKKICNTFQDVTLDSKIAVLLNVIRKKIMNISLV